MLSILIPVYNFNISELLIEVHKQATIANIEFEIICFDDKSETFTIENKKTINSLTNSRIILSDINLGRIESRQRLSNASIYDFLLFLDADVLPKSNKFIEQYLEFVQSKYEVIFGGFAYSASKPPEKFILRWKYGKHFEEISAKTRNLKPYRIIISANFFVKKHVFNKLNSKINRKSYGLDNYFAALLKQNKINVLHLDNEVYHLSLESSISYLIKTEDYITTLLWLFKEKKMSEHENRLLIIFVSLKRFKLNHFMNLIYNLFSSKMKKNILGTNPIMSIFQFYKLAFISHKELNS